MTTTFEDRVRADLHAAVGEATFHGFEPASVIGLGERAVRRRRISYAAGAAALAAVAVVGGLALGDYGPRRAATPPANTSTRQAATYAAELTVGDQGRYRITMDSDRRLVFETFDTSRGWVSIPVQPLAEASQPTWVTGSELPGTVLAVLPANVTHESPIVHLGTGARLDMSAFQELGPTGYRVQAYRLAGDDGPLTFEGWRWRDARTGRVVSTTGPLPSADFALPDGTRVDIWLDQQRQEWGLLDGSSAQGPLPAGSWSEPQVLASIEEGATRASGTVWGIAPAGTTSVTPRLTDGTVAPVTTAPVGDTGVVAFYGEFSGRARGVTLGSVDWRDGTGGQHSKDLTTR